MRLFTAAGVPVAWHFQANDPDTIGWITLCAYLCAAALCWRAAIADSLLRRMWLGLAALLAILGFNKQLDFQTLLIGAVRFATKDPGWYTDRSLVKRVCIRILTIAGLAGTAWLLSRNRARIGSAGPACAGLAMLIAYIGLRASPLSHASHLPHMLVSAPPHFLELGGLLLVALGAASALNAQR